MFEHVWTCLNMFELDVRSASAPSLQRLPAEPPQVPQVPQLGLKDLEDSHIIHQYSTNPPKQNSLVRKFMLLHSFIEEELLAFTGLVSRLTHPSTSPFWLFEIVRKQCQSQKRRLPAASFWREMFARSQLGSIGPPLLHWRWLIVASWQEVPEEWMLPSKSVAVPGVLKPYSIPVQAVWSWRIGRANLKLNDFMTRSFLDISDCWRMI